MNVNLVVRNWVLCWLFQEKSNLAIEMANGVEASKQTIIPSQKNKVKQVKKIRFLPFL